MNLEQAQAYADHVTLEALVLDGMLTPEQYNVLCAAVDVHANIVIAGEEGSGKTTLLIALVNQALRREPTARIAIVEDEPEIRVTGANLLTIKTTPLAPTSPSIHEAVRFNPDRLIVGDLRGAGTFDVMRAWRRGGYSDQGGLATVVAADTSDALNRLELMVAQHPGSGCDASGIVRNTVDFIVHLGLRPGAHPSQHCAALVNSHQWRPRG